MRNSKDRDKERDLVGMTVTHSLPRAHTMEQPGKDKKNNPPNHRLCKVKVGWVLEIQPLSKTGLTNTEAHAKTVRKVC